MKSDYEKRDRCNCCGSTQFTAFERYKRWHDLSIVKCENCGFAFVLEVPVDEKIKIENEDYFGMIDAGLGFPEIQKRQLARKKRMFRQIDSTINKYLPMMEISLMDIGCSYGSFLSYIKDRHPHCSTFGIDLAPAYSDFLNSQGHRYYTEFFEDLDFEDKFNVITLLEVLEHTKYPEKIVKHAYDNMIDGGLLIVEVPNLRFQWLKGKIEKRTLYKKIIRKDTWGLMPHVHLNYFSPRTLRKFFNDNGFEVIDILTRDITLNNQRYPFILRLFQDNWVKIAILFSSLGLHIGPAFIMVGRRQSYI